MCYVTYIISHHSIYIVAFTRITNMNNTNNKVSNVRHGSKEHYLHHCNAATAAKQTYGYCYLGCGHVHARELVLASVGVGMF